MSLAHSQKVGSTQQNGFSKNSEREMYKIIQTYFVDKAYIVMKKVPYDDIHKQKSSQKSLVELFRYFFPF